MEAKSGSLRRWMPLICDIVHLKISGLSSPLKQKEKLVVQYVCKMMNTMKNIQKGDDENGNMAPSSPVTLPDDVWPLAKPRTKTLCRVLAKGRDSHLSKQRTPLVVPVNKQVSRAQVQMYGGKGLSATLKPTIHPDPSRSLDPFGASFRMLRTAAIAFLFAAATTEARRTLLTPVQGPDGNLPENLPGCDIPSR